MQVKFTDWSFSGAGCHPKVADLEYQIDKTVKIKELQLENDKDPECFKQEINMKIDIKLEDFALLNHEVEIPDLKVECEIDEEPIIEDADDHKGEVCQYNM